MLIMYVMWTVMVTLMVLKQLVMLLILHRDGILGFWKYASSHIWSLVFAAKDEKSKTFSIAIPIPQTFWSCFNRKHKITGFEFTKMVKRDFPLDGKNDEFFFFLRCFRVILRASNSKIFYIEHVERRNCKRLCLRSYNFKL